MSSFASSSGSVTVSASGASNPLLSNMSILLANTEYSFSLPAGTKQFEFRSRLGAKLQIAYTSGDTGSIFKTIWSGCLYSETGLLLTASLDIYVQGSKPNDVLEILSWT